MLYEIGVVHKRYWWQGPDSPFSEGAAQGRVTSHSSDSSSSSANALSSIAPGSRAHSRPVIGCSGNGCDSGIFASSYSSPSSSSSHSSPSSSGGTYYWQQPGHPCSNYQGPGCPQQFNCVNYQSCSNGVMTSNGGGQSSSVPSFTLVCRFFQPGFFSGFRWCFSWFFF